MAVTQNRDSQFSIIIHTDSYAGNFQQELRGYVTGCSNQGDREGICDEIRQVFADDPDCDWEELDEDENPFSGLWKRVRGEWGWRIEELVQTRGQSTPNSVRLHCNHKPTAKQLALVKEWALKFADNSRMPKPENRHDISPRSRSPFWSISPINILGFTLECNRVTTVRIEEEF